MDDKEEIMENAFNNLCFSCEFGQPCCTKLSGLRLTESEYKQYFFDHRNDLKVHQEAGWYEISSDDICPKWAKNECVVYHDRPMECRLFPYTIGMIFYDSKHVYVTFYARTRCPKKRELLVSKAEARAMLLSFSRNIFPSEKAIEIKYEGFLNRFIYRAKKLIWNKSQGNVWC